MIAFQDDLAVAVFVETGESGSQTAGPLLEAFLSADPRLTARLNRPVACATVARMTFLKNLPSEPRTIDEPVAYWAEKNPDGEAVMYGPRSWTWAQWNERVRRAAGGLRELGVGRGDVVAFLDKNHPACVEITLAAGSLGRRARDRQLALGRRRGRLRRQRLAGPRCCSSARS